MIKNNILIEAKFQTINCTIQLLIYWVEKNYIKLFNAKHNIVEIGVKKYTL